MLRSWGMGWGKGGGRYDSSLKHFYLPLLFHLDKNYPHHPSFFPYKIIPLLLNSPCRTLASSSVGPHGTMCSLMIEFISPYYSLLMRLIFLLTPGGQKLLWSPPEPQVLTLGMNALLKLISTDPGAIHTL